MIGMIVLVVFLLYLFDRMRRRNVHRGSITKLLEPLQQWKDSNAQHISELNDRKEDIEEELQMMLFHVRDNKKRHLEQRAKVALVNSITPFIDRMIHEVDCLKHRDEPDSVKKDRYQYISELTAKINQYNEVLTRWIQMRQGTLNLRITSFALQPLFDIVQKGKMNFDMKGVELVVEPTEAVVKADRTLTLFMINTMADNARKFTPQGGRVMVSALIADAYVEICITDTGVGMDDKQLEHVFDRTYTGGHGFGLLNCKGIIEKYKKVSSIFSVCSIFAESELGKGSRFVFRLPRGIGGRLKSLSVGLVGLVGLMAMTCLPQQVIAQNTLRHQRGNAPNHRLPLNLQRADIFADSAYFSNINGEYERTLQYADSAAVTSTAITCRFILAARC